MTSTTTQTLRIERTFDCSLQDMWNAWTKPTQFARWISPFPGLDAEVHELDVRVGGKVRFTMIAPDGTRYPEEVGVFEVVDEPHEIVQFQSNEGRSDIFAGFPMRMRARFEADGERTRLIFEQTGLPPSFPLDAARGGFGSCFDKLATVVEGSS